MCQIGELFYRLYSIVCVYTTLVMCMYIILSNVCAGLAEYICVSYSLTVLSNLYTGLVRCVGDLSSNLCTGLEDYCGYYSLQSAAWIGELNVILFLAIDHLLGFL